MNIVINVKQIVLIIIFEYLSFKRNCHSCIFVDGALEKWLQLHRAYFIGVHVCGRNKPISSYNIVSVLPDLVIHRRVQHTLHCVSYLWKGFQVTLIKKENILRVPSYKTSSFLIYRILCRCLCLMVCRALKFFAKLMIFTKVAQWKNLNVPKMFSNTAKRVPNKIMFYYEDQTWTFKQVHINQYVHYCYRNL